METKHKNAAETKTAPKNKESTWRQLFKERARLNMPVLVYDYNREWATLQIRRKKNIGQSFPPTVDGLRDGV